MMGGHGSFDGLGGMGGDMGGDMGGFSGGDFNRAFDMDAKLYQLAAYNTTGGLLPEFTSPEEMLEYQNEVIRTFNHFKRKIQLGSYDYDFIKKQVLFKHGPFKAQEYSLEEDLLNILKEGERQERILKLQKGFSEIQESSRSDDMLDALASSFKEARKSRKSKKKKQSDKDSKISRALGEDEPDEELEDDLPF
jgi:hypothetical protein